MVLSIRDYKQQSVYCVYIKLLMHRDCVEELSCDQSHAPHLELFTDVRNVSVIVHHLDEGQVVSLPTVIVIVVMGGMILTAPVPNVMSTISSAMMGSLRLQKGWRQFFPFRCCVRGWGLRWRCNASGISQLSP